jgi:hypothetical protein
MRGQKGKQIEVEYIGSYNLCIGISSESLRESWAKSTVNLDREEATDLGCQPDG